MERYRVKGRRALFPAGSVLHLSQLQATARKHRLEPVKGRGSFDRGGLFTSLEPVEFKAGEEIGLEGSLSKAMKAVLEPAAAPVDPPESRGARAGKAS